MPESWSRPRAGPKPERTPTAGCAPRHHPRRRLRHGQGRGGRRRSRPRRSATILKSASGREHPVRPGLSAAARRKVILKEFQREPLRGKLLHADFYEVALDKKIEVKVHVELVGVPVGVKTQGGILDFVTRELEIECLPADIPEKIAVDVSHLELGKHLRVSDLKVVRQDQGADRARRRDRPRRGTARRGSRGRPVPWSGAVAEGAAAEPEVIKKGKAEARPRARPRRTQGREGRRRREEGEEVARASSSGLGNPGDALPPDAAQRRLHGGGRARRAGARAAGRDERRRLGGRGDARRRRTGAAGQAAHLHEPQRRARSARLLAEARGLARRPGRGPGRRGASTSARCACASGAATADTTACARSSTCSEPTSSPRVRVGIRKRRAPARPGRVRARRLPDGRRARGPGGGGPGRGRRRRA